MIVMMVMIMMLILVVMMKMMIMMMILRRWDCHDSDDDSDDRNDGDDGDDDDHVDKDEDEHEDGYEDCGGVCTCLPLRTQQCCSFAWGAVELRGPARLRRTPAADLYRQLPRTSEVVAYQQAQQPGILHDRGRMFNKWCCHGGPNATVYVIQSKKPKVVD